MSRKSPPQPYRQTLVVADRVAVARQKPGTKKATDNWRQIQFGSVLINSPALDAKAGRQGRAESQRALQALGQALGRPGVTLKEARGVPYYSADPQHPGVIIRRLDGKIAQGRVITGKFKENAA